MVISMRPKFSRSGKLGCAPTATPRFECCLDRSENRRRIAGVKTAGNIRGADQLEYLVIMSGAFPEIGIEVDDEVHAMCRRKPTRKRPKSSSRSRKSSCASAREISWKRTRSPGQSCAAIGKSTVITWAIFG